MQKSNAQDTMVTSGVFINVEDYQNNKLTLEASCKNEEEKFKTDYVFSRSSFDVIYKGKEVNYRKKDLYAYRDCKNEVWRFFDNKEYEIMETKDIYIYSLKKYILVVIDGGTIAKEPIYFFSKGPDGEIKELTIDNLKSVYPDNKKFHTILDSEIKAEKDVYAYDFKHKMYKVNYLFSLSKK